jgi:hemerythrin-like metal-binding protein
MSGRSSGSGAVPLPGVVPRENGAYSSDMLRPGRRNGPFGFLFVDVTPFLRSWVLRREAKRIVPGPRPAPHPPGTGPLWDASLATGIERIDRQHQLLMVALQRFEEAVQEGSALEIVNGTVKSLVRYADEHFTLEESYMAHIKYPRLPAHREDHARLRNRIEYLKQRSGDADPAKALELSKQVCQYLRVHIGREDAAYAEFARSA